MSKSYQAIFTLGKLRLDVEAKDDAEFFNKVCKYEFIINKALKEEGMILWIDYESSEYYNPQYEEIKKW